MDTLWKKLDRLFGNVRILLVGAILIAALILGLAVLLGMDPKPFRSIAVVMFSQSVYILLMTGGLLSEV